MTNMAGQYMSADSAGVATENARAGRTRKSAKAFRTISEVSDILDVPQHVLRFWETKFSQIRPMKRGGGRRYYRPEDVELLRRIRSLLYGEGYTIKGVRRLLREGGAKSLVENQEMAGALSSPAAVTSAAGIHAELRELLKELEALRSLLGKI